MWTFNLCTYNIMITVIEPIRHNGQRTRVSLLPSAILEMSESVREGIDVITFQELIPLEYRNILLNELALLGWKYHSADLSPDIMAGQLKAASGGVVIVSRHPIIAQHNSIFDTDCQGADCAACKGIVYCRVLLPDDNVVNVFSTHFQAWDTQKAHEIRRQQAQQCTDFIQSLHLPEDEAVVFSGDCNIDFYNNTTEITSLMGSMGLVLVKHDEKTHPFTSDPKTNKMMGNDETSMYATDLYPDGCYEEYIDTMSCPCCPREWLDYIAYSSQHLKPKYSMAKVYMMKTPTAFKMKLNVTTEREINDLSDHYPLIGTFTWSQPTPFKRRRIKCDMVKSSNTWWVLVVLGVIIIGITLLVSLGLSKF